jgi:hypothetical protein
MAERDFDQRQMPARVTVEESRGCSASHGNRKAARSPVRRFRSRRRETRPPHARSFGAERRDRQCDGQQRRCSADNFSYTVTDRRRQFLCGHTPHAHNVGTTKACRHTWPHSWGPRYDEHRDRYDGTKAFGSGDRRAARAASTCNTLIIARSRTARRSPGRTGISPLPTASDGASTDGASTAWTG